MTAALSILIRRQRCWYVLKRKYLRWALTCSGNPGRPHRKAPTDAENAPYVEFVNLRAKAGAADFMQANIQCVAEMSEKNAGNSCSKVYRKLTSRKVLAYQDKCKNTDT